MKAVTVPEIVAAKGKRKLTSMTAYDHATALYVDEAGIDMILVGDSLGMVIFGRPNTLSVTMDEMIPHVRAVSETAAHALVIADMPFMSYHVSPEQAVANAGRFLQESGAHAVKLEGGRRVAEQAKAIVKAQIPVQGHIGLTPQSSNALGGFKVQGTTAEAARQIIDDARALEDAGCFSIVLETIPAPIAELVTSAVKIPTIGIGAGPHVDGQLLVIHDVLGLYEKFTPRFVKQYAKLAPVIRDALTDFCRDVNSGAFPAPEHCFSMDDSELGKLYGTEVLKVGGGKR